MQVLVIANDEQITYGYDPCHYEAIYSFYFDLLKNKEIDGFVIEK
jgi:hypothetical protein